MAINDQPPVLRFRKSLDPSVVTDINSHILASDAV